MGSRVDPLGALRAAGGSLFTDPTLQTDWAARRLMWMADKDLGFVLVSVKEDGAGVKAVVEVLETHKQMEVPHEDLLKPNPPKFDRAEDMASLTSLNEAAVLHNLRERYFSNLVYTYSGLFCVVVNPYTRLPIYTEEIMNSYKGQRRSEVPPHIFAVADAAYRNMLQAHADQSILCTGESGAGKTENAKKVIQYLAHVAGSRGGPRSGTVAGTPMKKRVAFDLNTSSDRVLGQLEEQLLQANPLLEAFGNSKTVKNDNSSRFGKFVKVNFDKAGHIAGADIEFYLLEKSRVLHQAAQERSFHIFYQLLKGSTPEMREELLLERSPADYRFLTNGDISLPGVDDANDFQRTQLALGVLGFSDDEVRAMWRVLSAVLLLGNVRFTADKSGEQAVLEDDRVAQKVCSLLGLPVADFVKAFLRPVIKTTVRAQTAQQATSAAEAIAKALYERLFAFIVSKVNRSLSRSSHTATNYIGILDIAGFEIFEVNSFEQLCINYTNEKLQQLFNRTMFEREQEEYVAEGLEWNHVDFGLDLQPTIDLIEKNQGILPLLDEQCVFNVGTDRDFVDKLHANHNQNAKYIVPEMRSKSDFGIVHYAGRVDYTVQGWKLKNMDPLNENVVVILQSSGDTFVADLWKDAEFTSLASAEGGGRRTKGGMMRTVAHIYRDQVARLMTSLGKTVPHFVRCILPNTEKKTMKMDNLLVLNQLRCNGVLEGIRICRQGFPNRLPYQNFRQRYERLLAPKACPKGFIDGREATKRIVESLDISPNLVQFGQTKVFFRAGVLASLEAQRDEKLAFVVIRFQATCRGYLARREFSRRQKQVRAIRLIQRNVNAYLGLRDWPWWNLFVRVKPLLQVTLNEEAVAEKEEELRRAHEELQKTKDEATELKEDLWRMEKAKTTWEAERRGLEDELRNADLLKTKAENDRESMHDELTRLKEQLDMLMKEHKNCHDKIAKLSAEKTRLAADLAAKDEELLSVFKRATSAEASATDKGSEAEQLSKAKAGLAARLEEMEERMSKSREEHEEVIVENKSLRKELASKDSQLAEALAKLGEVTGEHVEEAKRRAQRDLDAAIRERDDALAMKDRAEKAKMKISHELEDAAREVTDLQNSFKIADRKLKKFDDQLAFEKEKTERAEKDKERVEQKLRETETRVLTLIRESEDLKATVAELEKAKVRLVNELETSTANGDEGRAASELSRQVRALEDEIDALNNKDTVQRAEDALTRAELENQGIRKEMERQLARKEEEEIDRRRSLERKVKMLEEELETAQREKAAAVAARKKAEADKAEWATTRASLEKREEDVRRKEARSAKQIQDLFDQLELARKELELEKEHSQKTYSRLVDQRRAADELELHLEKERRSVKNLKEQVKDLEGDKDKLEAEITLLRAHAAALERPAGTGRAPSMAGSSWRHFAGSNTSLSRASVDGAGSGERPESHCANSREALT